jgi:ATP-dependent DNA helicase RecG
VSRLKEVKVTEIKGIGENRASELHDLGILHVQDLMEYLPYRYEDYEVKNLSDARHDEKVTLVGKVHSEPMVRYSGRKKSRLSVRILIERYLITAIIFNRPFLKKQLMIGKDVIVTGKWDQHRMILTVQDIQFTLNQQNTIKPIYPLKGEWTNKAIQRAINLALDDFSNEIEENLPRELLNKYKLLQKKAAILTMHKPRDHKDLKQARRRIVYEELLTFQLKMQYFRKMEKEKTTGKQSLFSSEGINDFIKSLPFNLTSAQIRVVNEIITDMKSPYRMHRLLQGDVGSGKTVVAAIALFGVVQGGAQGALMVPTEILAEQHFKSLENLLTPFDIKIQLLTSSVKGKNRKKLLQELKEGKINILVGTHALIQDEVYFKELGLVITDEQHRFGVEQRKVLRKKGLEPDVLYMTATPIPRTLAISAFGDMDVSTIDKMPAGRKPIETYWARHDMLSRVLEFLRKELEKGNQAYVICPLIEDSDKIDVQNAIDVHAQLQQYFVKYSVGLMHGRLTPSEKEDVMQRFSENRHRVLVSTTVVEVGVNVPNATMMVIYDADRFGLAQLHQLRGRVGRGADQSYCVLIADPKSDVGKERMQIMTETIDGFTLSERDLELRGPGDFFGRKQSGLPEFKVADLVHDYRALEVARQDAAQFVNSKEFWVDEEYHSLREQLLIEVEQNNKFD